MSKFLSKRFENLEEYVPGEQPRDKNYIKLNTNESPFPPSDNVIRALNGEEIKNLRLYSDPNSSVLKNEIANFYGVQSENVFVSNGSDETINFFFMAFCDNEKKVAFPNISYGFYKVFADLYGLDYIQIPLNDDFTINVCDYLNTGRNICIANPNAPTGIALGLNDIEKIVKSNPDNIVLIDEAYVDFGAESAVNLTKKYNNLIVVQTFSKSRSLAGARLGFAIADKCLISDFEKIKFSTNPYNVNRLTQLAGVCSIRDREYFDENCLKIKKAREFTIKELTELGFTVTNSYANFVFAKSDKISGEKLYEELKQRHILVRHFNDKKISDYNRITIGSLSEMTTLISEIKKILEEYK